MAKKKDLEVEDLKFLLNFIVKEQNGWFYSSFFFIFFQIQFFSCYLRKNLKSPISRDFVPSQYDLSGEEFISTTKIVWYL